MKHERKLLTAEEVEQNEAFLGGVTGQYMRGEIPLEEYNRLIDENYIHLDLRALAEEINKHRAQVERERIKQNMKDFMNRARNVVMGFLDRGSQAS